MTNNFNWYKEFVQLPETNPQGLLDRFYVVELIRRGKDNPGLPAANYHFKNYYIYCKQDLDKYSEEIKTLCSILKLRAYCSVNWKSTKQVALNTLAAMATRISKDEYRKIWAEWKSQCGKFKDNKDKKWIVDIDDININLNIYKNIIFNCEPIGDKIRDIVSTKSGVHLITTPFNKHKFEQDCRIQKIDIPNIKENHLTLLYENL